VGNLDDTAALTFARARLIAVWLVALPLVLSGCATPTRRQARAAVFRDAGNRIPSP
jgi:hypothetical protein